MKKTYFIWFFSTLLLLLFSNKSWSQDASQEGLASYYHDMFEGRKTASGEVFDQSKWTAAHKHLPFDSWVKVTDPEGKEVVVRINDRLPSNSSRIIDLTKKTAEEFEMLLEGIKKVTITSISPQEAWTWFQNHIFLRPIYLYMTL